MSSIKNKVVVITGASSGIGRAAALQFAAQGARLVLTARGEDPLEELAGKCEHKANGVLSLPADMSDEADVKALVEATLEKYGRIDIWVNNAAVIAYGQFEEIPSDWWRRVIDVNLFGYYHAARHVIPVFREQGGGTLINVGSILSRMVIPYQSAYIASKHAIHAMSESIRQETRDLDTLYVCDVLPGATDTPLFDVAANVSGKNVVPPMSPDDARKAAAVILKSARKPKKRERVVGGLNKATIKAHKNLERPVEGVMTRVTESQHFEDEPRSRTEGNLFSPDSHSDSIDGGFRDESQDQDKKGLLSKVVPVLLVTGLAVAARTVTRSRSFR